MGISDNSFCDWNKKYAEMLPGDLQQRAKENRRRKYTRHKVVSARESSRLVRVVLTSYRRWTSCPAGSALVVGSAA